MRCIFLRMFSDLQPQEVDFSSLLKEAGATIEDLPPFLRSQDQNATSTGSLRVFEQGVFGWNMQNLGWTSINIKKTIPQASDADEGKTPCRGTCNYISGTHVKML